MSASQKVIKYSAIALAFLIIFSIFTCLVSFILSITSSIKKEDEIKEINAKNNYKNLTINLRATSLTIKKGEKFKVSSNNDKITIKQSDDSLTIKETKTNFNFKEKLELIIYIPDDYVFDDVSIKNGAGKIDITELNSQELSLELGAGSTILKNVNILKETKIECGAGSFKILSGNINNLDLDLGVGKTSISAKITGNNKIDSGIGSLDLNLDGIKNDYKLKLKKGLGSITIDGASFNESLFGEGTNYIDIDGGIGSINIAFKNEEI